MPKLFKQIFLASLFLMPAISLSALEITPETVYFRGRPGQKLKKKVRLINNGSDKVNVRIRAFWEDRDPERSGGRIKVSRKQFNLKPNRSRTVTVSCRVPDQRGEVLGRLEIKSSPEGKGWIETRSLHHVYVRIEGTETASADFLEVHARKLDGMILIEASLKNTGNMHIQPKLVATIEKQGGARVTKIFDARVMTIPPRESAGFSTTMDAGDFSLMSSTGILNGFFKNADGETEKVSQTFVIE